MSFLFAFEVSKQKDFDPRLRLILTTTKLEKPVAYDDRDISTSGSNLARWRQWNLPRWQAISREFGPYRKYLFGRSEVLIYSTNLNSVLGQVSDRISIRKLQIHSFVQLLFTLTFSSSLGMHILTQNGDVMWLTGNGDVINREWERESPGIGMWLTGNEDVTHRECT